ncbi:MAG TPA: hypothetical protein VFH29_02795 [Anaerolineales bacterium]|nr:hypothetical protein [Anaerolineales bacterium]
MKDLLGRVPVAAEAYAALRPQRPRTRYNLEQLGAHLPAAIDAVRAHGAVTSSGKHLILFATLHYWIEQAVMVGLVLRGMGHDVTIAYLPYSDWQKPINGFDLRRQDVYTRRVLAPLTGLVNVVSLCDRGSPDLLPESLAGAVERASSYDVMYSLQTEAVDQAGPLYRLRMVRNAQAGAAAFSVLQDEAPSAALIPNGLVTELAMFFQAARSLDVPTITYEFNDQREQIWLAQDDVVMNQNTDGLWQARRDQPLTARENEVIHEFEASRSGGGLYAKGTRRWQDVPKQGTAALRAELELDDRPIVLLATNVLGDSLTLGRNVFAESMADWIGKTVRYLAARPEIQLLVRIHPGERLIHGPSIESIIERALPSIPSHVHIIGPRQTTNTYDLMDMASLGLVYTTTVGMEMAMRGVPVIVAGRTHYRGRGFTMDPSSWDEYFQILNRALERSLPAGLEPDVIDTAWRYAYRFLFDYPQAFPWRLMHFWKDMGEWPVGRVLSPEGQMTFGQTFKYLSGEKIVW